MLYRYQISKSVLDSVAGGRSVIDLPRLACKTDKEAEQFILAYGFDPKDPEHAETLWHIHRRALVFLIEKMGCTEEEIPVQIKDRKVLGDLKHLLLWASLEAQTSEEKTLQRWSCALLRVMHAYVHSETDLFSLFTEEIQNQVLSPVQHCVVHDGLSGKTFLQKEDPLVPLDSIPLVGFQVKPFKTSSSAVIKLLAKPDALAMNIYDRLGFRFVTENLVDCFRVLRFLVESNLVSYPHVIPEQSTNTLYPIDLFIRLTQELQQTKQNLRGDELDQYLLKVLQEKRDEISFVKKENQFSSSDYRFIKFIARRLIQVPMPDQPRGVLRFFFPYEVQIMDRKSFQTIQAGPSQHEAYKDRQKLAARKRIFQDHSV